MKPSKSHGVNCKMLLFTVPNCSRLDYLTSLSRSYLGAFGNNLVLFIGEKQKGQMKVQWNPKLLFCQYSFCFSTKSKGAHSFTSNRVLDVHEFEHAGTPPLLLCRSTTL